MTQNYVNIKILYKFQWFQIAYQLESKKERKRRVVLLIQGYSLVSGPLLSLLMKEIITKPRHETAGEKSDKSSGVLH